MNDDQKTAIRNFLQASNETLNTLNKALEKPYFWADYNAVGPIIIEANSVLVSILIFLTTECSPRSI